MPLEPSNPLVCRTDTFTAHSRIIRGRFIVRASYQFSGNLSDESKSDAMLSKMPFCPHHLLGDINNPGYHFLRMVHFMFRWPNRNPREGVHQQRFSCERCPSDYEIVMKDKILNIRIWRDLGTGACPEDPCWQSQVASIENIYSSVSRGFSIGNFRSSESKYPYEHGSIRTMFDSGGTSQDEKDE